MIYIDSITLHENKRTSQNEKSTPRIDKNTTIMIKNTY